VYRQELGRPRPLVEVEIVDQVVEHRADLPDVRSAVRTAVRRRIKPLASEEIILDAPGVGVVAQDLMIDEAAARIRADHQPGHPHAQPEVVDRWRADVVVKTSPVIPGELMVLMHVGEVRQRVPDSGRAGALLSLLASAQSRVVCAVRRSAPRHVVPPTDVMLVEQVGEIGPR
jgi:hypothetical protein